MRTVVGTSPIALAPLKRFCKFDAAGKSAAVAEYDTPVGMLESFSRNSSPLSALTLRSSPPLRFFRTVPSGMMNS